MNIKISVIIPLYNKAPYIKRALQSVINQTYKPYEIIVINDGSTDKGPSIVKSFDNDKIRLINQKNSGVSTARNRGIKEAKGNFIALLDADDEWLPNHLKTKIKFYNDYPNVGAIGSSFVVKENNKKKYIPNFKFVPKDEGIINNYFKAALHRNPTWSSVIIFPKEVFYDVGGFPENLNRGEDNFMWSKIALSYEIGFVNEPSAIRYKNVSDSLSKKPKYIDGFPIFKYIKNNNIKTNKSERYYLSELANKKYLMRANQCIILGKRNKAKNFLKKANNTEMFRKELMKIKIKYYLPTHLYRILRKIKFSIFGLF